MRQEQAGGFRHEAVLYRGLDDLRTGVLPFVREGVDREEPVMVAMLPDRVELLRDELGVDAKRVEFVDMAEVGGNPARIIPEWRRFLDLADGPAWGVGEPVWAGRRSVEVDECVLHESLLNVAFDVGPAWRLLCPYDAAALEPEVLETVYRTHPEVDDFRHAAGGGYLGHDLAHQAFGVELPEPAAPMAYLVFGSDDLGLVRELVRGAGMAAGLGEEPIDDLVLAAHELAANSIHHGGGEGTVRAWLEPGAFVVDVRDAGRITDPLVGRELAAFASETGRGVWMANQLCDLVQVRSSGSGTVVRLFAWI